MKQPVFQSLSEMPERVRDSAIRARVGITGSACLCMIAVATPLLVGGCSREPGDATYTAVSGTIEEINASNHVIKFRYKHAKTGEYRDRHAIVARDTEILINGRLSKLSDLRIGERVFGIWRIEEIGDRDRVSAVKIEIVREDDDLQTDDAATPSE